MSDESPPRLLPTLVLWAVGIIVVISIVGWIIGAVFSAIRSLLLIGIAVAVIWAIVSSRADR